MIWQTSSKKCSITKIFESAPLENASRFEKEICLEFVEKVPVSGDTLVALFNNPRMLRKVRLTLPGGYVDVGLHAFTH